MAFCLQEFVRCRFSYGSTTLFLHECNYYSFHFYIVLGPEAPERILQVKNLVRPELVKLLKHCVDHCGFNHRQIVLFGFSQGAEIALDLAAFGGMNLRAVISIAGYMMEESANEAAAVSPLTTKIMVVQGDKDSTRTVKEAKERIKPVQRIFGKGNVEQRIVAGMGHGMPRDEVSKDEKWRVLKTRV